MISYLEIFDKAAGAIKSGGTTRRAAKMVVLDADHPEILEFIHWKMNEERKARVLLANGYSAAAWTAKPFAPVSGQNSNNSVRVHGRVSLNGERLSGGSWVLRYRRTGKVPPKNFKPLLAEILRRRWPAPRGNAPIREFSFKTPFKSGTCAPILRDSLEQSLQRIYVPRQFRLQFGLAQFGQIS